MKTSSRTAAAWRSSAPSLLDVRNGLRALRWKELRRTSPGERSSPFTQTAAHRRRPAPKTPPPASSSRRRSSGARSTLAAVVLALVCAAAPARANPGVAAIEIDTRAEALIDARALRRRVELELADV